MIGYKLFRLRKDGTLGPLFINRRQRIEIGTDYIAESHPTPGYKYRPYWHVCSEMNAPHLSKKDRVWAKVKISCYHEQQRPASQGGKWYLASYLTVLEIVQ